MTTSTATPSKDAGRQAVLASGHGMGVRRNGRWLIRNVDLAVHAGEIVTVIGPNGGGKSTSARALLGLIGLDEGAIDRKPGLTVGYVPQRLVVDTTLPLTMHRFMTLTARHSDDAIADALARTGISHLADAQVHTLSGGEFQRAKLARAIVRRPDLLVLDEPVQGVDFMGEIALYKLIGEIREEYGCGILLISHDLHIVMAATDTVVCLNEHVCCAGAPETIVEDVEYQRLFGDHGASTLGIYRHAHDHEHGPDGEIRPLQGGRENTRDNTHGHAHNHHGHSHDHTHRPDR